MVKFPCSFSISQWVMIWYNTSPSSSHRFSVSWLSMASRTSPHSSTRYFFMDSWVWTLSQGQPFSLSRSFSRICFKSSNVYMISSAFLRRIPRNTDGPIRNAVLRSHLPSSYPPAPLKYRQEQSPSALAS